MAALLLAAWPQTPQFKSGVERILIDVQVVDAQGRPIPALLAGDFEVKIDQGIRAVASVEFIRVADLTSAAAATQGVPRTSATTSAPAPAGRDFILAVDESSFHTRYAPAAVRAARGFVERLSPADRVGVFTYPVHPREFVMTTDHAAAIKSLDGIVGTLDLPMSEFHLTRSEVIDIAAGDEASLARVAGRACPRGDGSCRRRITLEADTMAATFESQAAMSMAGLRSLFSALHQDPERKTVVILSGGLLASDRVGGRPDVSAVIMAMGEQAARANATLYVLHLDSSFLEAFSPAGGGASTSLMRDTSVSEGGLARLAGTAGGTLVHVEPGGEDRAFQRILRETSAYYLLAVEPADRDRDGRAHYISVRIKVKGADVRARRTVIVPAR